jgi:hypothetical protein
MVHIAALPPFLTSSAERSIHPFDFAANELQALAGEKQKT